MKNINYLEKDGILYPELHINAVVPRRWRNPARLYRRARRWSCHLSPTRVHEARGLSVAVLLAYQKPEFGRRADHRHRLSRHWKFADSEEALCDYHCRRGATATGAENFRPH